ncbi:SMEK domain-containing protein [Klebsiella variicola subsp. variicola]|nr:SMEK domain-containing protein [Klebsiella variicola subsp. variicola]
MPLSENYPTKKMVSLVCIARCVLRIILLTENITSKFLTSYLLWTHNMLRIRLGQLGGRSMLNRKDNIDKISTKLAILAHKVELNSCLNLMDLNIHAEYFFCDLLNMIFNASLVNLNTINTNAKSIDLIDLRKKTSHSSHINSRIFQDKENG